jgi:hypothetical protein
MAGFGIQKRGTSPLLVKRKGFVSGGDVNEALDPIEKRAKPLSSLEEKKPKTFTEDVKDGVKKLVKAPSEITKDVVKTVEKVKQKINEDPGIMGTGDPQRKFKKSKSPVKDEPMKPMKKLAKEEKETPEEETREEMKKGGSAKKGILIIIGTKDKKSKSMKKGGMIKKGMHKMPNSKIMKNSDMKKGMKK